MSKVTITREIQIDYGHTLPNHFAFCNQIHGHRGIIKATVSGEIVQDPNDSSQGMVLDFKFLKAAMMERIHDVLDHGFAVWSEDDEDKEFITKRNQKYLITDEPPTAEYLAKWAFKVLLPALPTRVELDKVEWYETPNACAIYTRDNYKADTVSNV